MIDIENRLLEGSEFNAREGKISLDKFLTNWIFA